MSIFPKHTHPGPLSTQNPRSWFGEFIIVTLWSNEWVTFQRSLTSMQPDVWSVSYLFFPGKGKKGSIVQPHTSAEQQTGWLLCFLVGLLTNRNSFAKSCDDRWGMNQRGHFIYPGRGYCNSLLHFHTVTYSHTWVLCDRTTADSCWRFFFSSFDYIARASWHSSHFFDIDKAVLISRTPQQAKHHTHVGQYYGLIKLIWLMSLSKISC